MSAAGRIEVIGPLPDGSAGGGLFGLVSGDGLGDPLPVRLVAVPPRVAGEPGLLAQLRRDAAAAAELLHPNILRTFGIEEVDGAAMQVLSHVEAHSLRAIIEAGGRLPPEIAARIVADACAAIEFAEDQGKGGPRLQGDLCLDTLLVAESGATLVAGLGGPSLARPSRERLHMLSPEQIIGGPSAMTPQTDVYLLGVLLHACLAGEPPFAEEPDPEAAVLTKPPPPLVAIGIPEALADVVARALAKKAQDRIRSPGALAEEISKAAGELAEPAVVATYVELLFPPEDEGRTARRAAFEAALAARRVAPAPPAPAEQAPPLPQPPAASEEITTPAAAPEAAPARPPVPEAAPAQPAVPEPDLVTTADLVADTGRPPPPDVAVAADIAVEPKKPPRVPDLPRTPGAVVEPEQPPQAPALPSTVGVVVEPEKPPRVPDLPSTASVPVEPEQPPRVPDLPSTLGVPVEPEKPPRVPDLVSTADIVGEGSSPIIEPRPPLPEPPQRRGAWYAAAVAVAVACFAIGYIVSQLGTPEPPAGAGSPPTAVADPLPARDRGVSVAAVPPPASAVPSPVPVPAPPPPRAAPASAAKASLNVSADPAGNVFVDGKLAGRSPLVKAVGRGLHKVRLYDAASGVDVTRMVEAQGPGTRVRFALAKGTVTITAPAGSSISLDDRRVATTEIRDFPIWEGHHKLVVTLGSARHSHEFQLEAGGTYTYEVSQTTVP